MPPGVVSEEENRMVNKMEVENRAGQQMLALKDDPFFPGIMTCKLGSRWLLVVNRCLSQKNSEASITTKVNNEKTFIVGNYNKPF